MRSALRHLSLAKVLPINNPVLPGDHPDPTILRVGHQFWASATSGEWSPQFPLFHSTDLLTWTPAGAIFPTQPTWARGDFWAPELVQDRGRFVAYYVARARANNRLTIAAATAAFPGGPWTDHGPILAEPAGSIDPCFARDEHGHPFLIWKTDGNSQGKPTPIRAQPLTPDLLHLTGSPTTLIVNDQPWEAGVVEGPYILRHDHRFYLFYAGNACCGRECNYAEGVARADHLLGPWTKCPVNPIIGANATWRCPGHGTAVRGGKGQDYLLYHAYPATGDVYVGREALLDEIVWTPEGWPAVNAGHGPHVSSPASPIDLVDDFVAPTLGNSWQWPVNTQPAFATGSTVHSSGALALAVPAARQSAMVAVPAPGAPRYTATVTLAASSWGHTFPEPAQPESPTYNKPPATAWAGLAVIGDPFNTMGLGLREGVLELWNRHGGAQHTAWSHVLSPAPARIDLRVTSTPDAQLTFFYSLDGVAWLQAGPAVTAAHLPAWDRGLRIGLMLDGPERTAAMFQHFQLTAR